MNKAIRRLAFAAMVLMVALLANLTYVQFFKAQAYDDKQGNARTVAKEYSVNRGPILVGGTPVAQSVAVNDKYRYQRQYNSGPLYAFATGYYSFQYGRAGVENSSNLELNGTAPDLAFRRVIDIISNKPQQGASVQLTLNSRAQAAAYKALGNRTGAAVAIDPRTGAILALVSTPSYDPNTLATHDFSKASQAWKSLNANPKQPLLDRALRSTYPPGSTFKLITTAAALTSGRYNPNSYVYAPKVLKLPQTTITLPNENNEACAPAGSTQTTLTIGLDKSCNTVFGNLGLQLGADTLRDQADKFGFGQTYLDELTMAPSQFPTNPTPPQVALSAIGQFDVRATPLQMAMVAGGIANGGVVMKPYLVANTKTPDLKTVSQTKPQKLNTAMSPQVAAQLNQMMVSVVNNGTGSPAKISGIQVAGKTGTAQSAKNRPPYAWFVAFAPADKPQIAVAVVIEDASGVARDDISGGGLAAPVAKSMITAVVNR